MQKYAPCSIDPQSIKVPKNKHKSAVFGLFGRLITGLWVEMKNNTLSRVQRESMNLPVGQLS
ncbi:hypothetical protein [Thiobacillus sp.]